MTSERQKICSANVLAFLLQDRAFKYYVLDLRTKFHRYSKMVNGLAYHLYLF